MCVAMVQRMSRIKLLAEVLLITKMNTVVGKYIKGLNIFLSYLTWNVLNIIWLPVIKLVSKIPAECCKNSMTMLLMARNTTKIMSTIFAPKYGECTIIALFLFYYYTTTVLWSLNNFCVATDHRKSIIFKA
jgi:hypothetical protein